MTIECYHKFNLNINQILNLDYIERKAREHDDKRMTLVISELALKSNFLSFLKNYGIRDYLMLFLQKAGDLNEQIHTDYATETDPHHYSFNIICKGQGVMTWFNNPLGGGNKSKHPNDPTRIMYETFKGLDLDPIDSWSDGKIALVRTGLPHGVKNNGSEDRICLSIRIDDYGWEEAKKIYRECFKDVVL
jgi:hypothetical protein